MAYPRKPELAALGGTDVFVSSQGTGGTMSISTGVPDGALALDSGQRGTGGQVDGGISVAADGAQGGVTGSEAPTTSGGQGGVTGSDGSATGGSDGDNPNPDRGTADGADTESGGSAGGYLDGTWTMLSLTCNGTPTDIVGRDFTNTWTVSGGTCKLTTILLQSPCEMIFDCTINYASASTFAVTEGPATCSAGCDTSCSAVDGTAAFEGIYSASTQQMMLSRSQARDGDPTCPSGPVVYTYRKS